MRTLPWDAEITLDASESKDPNEMEQWSGHHLDFEWYCMARIMRNQSVLHQETDVLQSCFDSRLDTVQYFGAVWNIPAKLLQMGVEYNFQVVVINKMEERKNHLNQTIRVVDTEIPLIVIR